MQLLKKEPEKKDKKKKDSKHGLYRGLINCDECGCTFSPDTNRHVKLGRNVESECYYYCTNSKHFHTKKPPGTSDKKLTDLFGKLFKQMELPQEDLDRLVSTLKESHEGKKRFTKEETEFCRKEIDRYEQMIENAYEDKCKPQNDPSSITQAQYDKMRSKWRGIQEGYEAKLQKIMKADEEYYITASYLVELASRSYELFMGSEPEQKRQLVTLVFQNLRMKDGKLYYDWVKPFDSIFVSAKNNNWGGWRGSNPRPSVPQTDALTN